MESQPQNPEFRINPENFHQFKSTHLDVFSLQRVKCFKFLN